MLDRHHMAGKIAQSLLQMDIDQPVVSFQRLQSYQFANTIKCSNFFPDLDLLLESSSGDKQKKSSCYDKIFMVGMNKTATTYFAQRSIKKRIYSTTDAQWCREARIKSLSSDMIRSYDFFSDGDPNIIPNKFILEASSEWKSLFIHQIKPLFPWLVSRWNHFERNKQRCSVNYENNIHTIAESVLHREINTRRWLVLRALDIFNIKFINSENVDFDLLLEESKIKPSLSGSMQKFLATLKSIKGYNLNNNFSSSNDYIKNPKDVLSFCRDLNLPGDSYLLSREHVFAICSYLGLSLKNTANLEYIYNSYF